MYAGILFLCAISNLFAFRTENNSASRVCADLSAKLNSFCSFAGFLLISHKFFNLVFINQESFSNIFANASIEYHFSL
jgi:hypothetical protein